MFSNYQSGLLRLRTALGHSGLDQFSASKEGVCRGVALTAICSFVLDKALKKLALEKGVDTRDIAEFQP